MQLYTLTRPVVKTGRSLCGFSDSTVTCSPAAMLDGFNPLVLECGGSEAAISLRTVAIKNRRIRAACLGHVIEAVEHYSPLRFLFPGTRFSASRPEFPHFTCAGPLVKTLMTQATAVNIETPWFTIEKPGLYLYDGKRGGLVPFTFIQPSEDKKLSIEVTVSFPQFGKMTKRFVFPDELLLIKVLSAPTLGMPSWLEKPAKMLWCHAHKTYWPKADDEGMLDAIIDHRVQDILGAIALLESPVKGAFPSLKVTSQCSGHFADLFALKEVRTIPLS